MSDVLDTASAWLDTQNAAYRATSIDYRRGDRQISLSATLGRSSFEVDNGEGIVLRVETRDYLVAVSDLEEFGLPRAGDRIVESLSDGTRCEYEVAASTGEPCWRYSDLYRRLLRIHTKQADTV